MALKSRAINETDTLTLISKHSHNQLLPRVEVHVQKMIKTSTLPKPNFTFLCWQLERTHFSAADSVFDTFCTCATTLLKLLLEMCFCYSNTTNIMERGDLGSHHTPPVTWRWVKFDKFEYRSRCDIGARRLSWSLFVKFFRPSHHIL